MSEDRVVGAFAVAVEVLRHNRRDGHGNTDEDVVVDTNPVDVEPGQSALGGAPWPPLTTTAFREPGQGPDPGFDGMQIAEVLFLRVQVRSKIMAHEREEGSDSKGFVAVTHDLKIDGVPVVVELEEGGGGVDGNHEQNADDLALLSRFRVVVGVHKDEVEREGDGDDGTCSGDDKGEVVEGQRTGDEDLGSGEDWGAGETMLACSRGRGGWAEG